MNPGSTLAPTAAARGAAVEAAGSPSSDRTLRLGLGLAGRLPRAWTASRRRRRCLCLALAAPGFVLVAAAPWHRAFGLLASGVVLFAAALVVRRWTEPLFVRAETAGLWPPCPPLKPNANCAQDPDHA
jgi:hypothetical protein